MLVLSRHAGEAIQIGDDIQVVVVELRGDKVRLGITAPPTVRVDRHEVVEERFRNGQAGPPMQLPSGLPPTTLKDNAERYGRRDR